MNNDDVQREIYTSVTKAQELSRLQTLINDVTRQALERKNHLADDAERAAEVLLRKARELRAGHMPSTFVYGSNIGSLDGELAAIRTLHEQLLALKYVVQENAR